MYKSPQNTHKSALNHLNHLNITKNSTKNQIKHSNESPQNHQDSPIKCPYGGAGEGRKVGTGEDQGNAAAGAYDSWWVHESYNPIKITINIIGNTGLNPHKKPMVPPTSLLVELLTHRKSIEKGWFNPQKRWFNEIDRPLPDFFLMATNLGSKLTINGVTYWLIAGEGP